MKKYICPAMQVDEALAAQMLAESLATPFLRKGTEKQSPRCTTRHGDFCVNYPLFSCFALLYYK